MRLNGALTLTLGPRAMCNQSSTSNLGPSFIEFDTAWSIVMQSVGFTETCRLSPVRDRTKLLLFESRYQYILLRQSEQTNAGIAAP